MKTQQLAIFDLDGCVSDDRWRRHMLPLDEEIAERGADAWHEYHRNAQFDDPCHVNLVHSMSDDYHLVFITSRPESYAVETFEWIRRVLGVKGNFHLLSRWNGNSDPSPLLKRFLFESTFGAEAWASVAFAFDDRQDVLDEYARRSAATCVKLTVESEAPSMSRASESPAEVLKEAAKTYEERNAVYGSNWRRVPEVMKAMFPDGVPGELVTEPHWHLFELIVVKLTRFAKSNLSHEDSIHDAMVYSAMIESILKEEQE